MLNDDLLVIILYPKLFLFLNPHFLQSYPVAHTTKSRIVGTRKERGQKH